MPTIAIFCDLFFHRRGLFLKKIKKQKFSQVATVAKTKEKKVVKKFEKKIYDARSDPIPKPAMYPAPRPPRDHIPQRVVPNSSLGVTMALADGSSPRGDSVLGVSPHLAVSCPALSVPTSGRVSEASNHSDVIHMIIKQVRIL